MVDKNINIMTRQRNILSVGTTVCFIISLASAYYINDVICPIIFYDFEYLKYLIYVILFFSLFLYIIYYYKETLGKNGIVLLLFCFLLLGGLSYERNYIDLVGFFKLFLLTPFLFLKNGKNTGKYLNKFVFVFLIFNSIFLSFIGGITDIDSIRFIFNSNDPNFSAIYLLFGFMICDKLKYNWLKCSYMVLGLTTGSRNFILAILVFYIIRNIKNIKMISFLLKKIKPLYVFLIMEIVVIFLGMWFISSVDISTDEGTRALNDGSNRARFTYSTLGFLFLISGGKKAFVDGAGARYWETGTVDSLMVRGVHNSFLGLFVEKGIIMGSIILLFLFFIVHSYYREENYEYIYAFLVASLFLGSLTANVFLFCWCYILAVRKIK
jgi:hypothetical protein